MGVGTLLAITRTLGLCGVLYVDPALVAEMAWLQRIATPQSRMPSGEQSELARAAARARSSRRFQ
jgi:hypothetical protein